MYMVLSKITRKSNGSSSSAYFDDHLTLSSQAPDISRASAPHGPKHLPASMGQSPIPTKNGGAGFYQQVQGFLTNESKEMNQKLTVVSRNWSL